MNFVIGTRWKYGVITEVLGERHYMIQLDDQLVKRHIDQILASSVERDSVVLRFLLYLCHYHPKR